MRAGGAERTTFRRLAELKQLGLVIDKGKSRFGGTTNREVRVPATILPDEPEDEDDREIMTPNILRELRERRRQQEHNHEIFPGSALKWERASRLYYPEQWQIIDSEENPQSLQNETLPDRSENDAVRDGEVVSFEDVDSILPDTNAILSDRSEYTQSYKAAMLPDSASILPDSPPMLPLIVAHDSPDRKTSHKDQKPLASLARCEKKDALNSKENETPKANQIRCSRCGQRILQSEYETHPCTPDDREQHDERRRLERSLKNPNLIPKERARIEKRLAHLKP